MSRLVIQAIRFLSRWAAVWAVIAAPAAACAGEVTLQTQMAASGDGGRLVVVARAASMGSASAYEIRGVLRTLGREIEGVVAPPGDLNGPHEEGAPEALITVGDVRFRKDALELEPGEAVLLRFTLYLPRDLSGSRPASLLISYQDENGHPLSSVAAIVFRTPGAQASGVEGSARSLTMRSRGEWIVSAHNPGDEPLLVTASLALPNALSCSQAPVQVLLPARGDEEIVFPLRRQDDLGGAHAVFCFLEHDVDGGRRTAMVQSQVMLKPRANWFSRTRAYWLVLDGVLIAVLLGLWMREALSCGRGDQSEEEPPLAG